MHHYVILIHFFIYLLRVLIVYYQTRFEGSKDCFPTITQSFKKHFVGLYPNFSDVPKNVKDL